ncbi:MAG TPA: hypothetical protein VGB02_12930 [Pyrinomonadaceae bacterium]
MPEKEKFDVKDALDFPFEMTDILAKTPTRLKKFDQPTQERIINWGYAICDASTRKYFDEKLPPPEQFPYQAHGVG